MGTPQAAPRDEVGEVQRARMVAAAIEAIAELGYAGMTVAEVIARARVSRRTFYEVFGDREDCFLAAFEETLARAEQALRAAYRQETRWLPRTRAALIALLCFCDEQPAFGRLLVVDALGAGPRVLQRRATVVATLVQAVDQGRAEARQGRSPGPLAAEGVVGAVLAVLYARMLDSGRREPLVGLAGALMSMIVLPYLGAAAAERELARPTPQPSASAGRRRPAVNPLHGLKMRLTYRTLRVLASVAEQPGASNRGVADRAGIVDQGQTSKLLARLEQLGLIENARAHASGEPNAWALTARGEEIVLALDSQRAVR
jgi:AcrR family transcriptional regulator/DNA-binding MarR family transcriptional regulator